MLKYFVLFFFFRGYLSASVGSIDNPFVAINAEEPWEETEVLINGTYYQTVKQYYCRSASTTNQELLVYGSSAWSFTLQDVNLTLQYPPNNANREPDKDYNRTITELRVMLYMEGSNSRGYITRGGLLQNNISVTFIVGSVSRLSYHFWLYGTSLPPPPTSENYNGVYRIC